MRPVPVDGQGRVGLVALEHEVDGLARGAEGGVGERAARGRPAR